MDDKRIEEIAILWAKLTTPQVKSNTSNYHKESEKQYKIKYKQIYESISTIFDAGSICGPYCLFEDSYSSEFLLKCKHGTTKASLQYNYGYLMNRIKL